MFVHIRGSCVGNPLSPMICEGAILSSEIKWQCPPGAKILPCRYVDNLLGLSAQPHFGGWTTDFYFAPINLETCTDHKFFLGGDFYLINGRLACQYHINPEKWRYVNPKGPGPSTDHSQASTVGHGQHSIFPFLPIAGRQRYYNSASCI